MMIKKKKKQAQEKNSQDWDKEIGEAINYEIIQLFELYLR